MSYTIIIATKFEFSMTIVVILYDLHTLEFALYIYVAILIASYVHIVKEFNVLLKFCE